MTLPLIIILFFLALLIGIIALIMTYGAVTASPAYQLKKRLRRLALKGDERLAEDVTGEIIKEISPFDRRLYKIGLIQRIERDIDMAGMKIDYKVFVLLVLVCALVFLGIGLALGRGTAIGIVFFLIGGAAPLFYLSFRKRKRLLKFTEQFPNALDMIARAFKVGHSLPSATLMVGDEMSEPIAGLFKTAYEAQTLGLSIKDALEQMLESMPSADLQLFVTAVTVHREVGGNIAESLEKLAAIIRERLKIRRQIRVYSAQGRLSGYILVALPPLMALFFYLTTPGYIEELVTTTMGRYGIAYAVISQIVGFLVIRRIINVRI
jgi:tight adherence protein B